VSFLRKAVVRQVATEQENVRRVIYRGEQRLQDTLRCLLYVQVAYCG
jgi:hypothetical protein